MKTSTMQRQHRFVQTTARSETTARMPLIDIIVMGNGDTASCTSTKLYALCVRDGAVSERANGDRYRAPRECDVPVATETKAHQ